MPNHPTLTNLLERARRRLVGQLALDKAALAMVIGMGGAILLLLFGTQILDWYWPVLLIAASLSVGIYSVRKSLPSFYQLAQMIDRRLGLADSLSTAVHFAEHPQPGRESICESQGRTAEVVAQSVDVNLALPATRSRYLLPATGLILVAFGLFAVRYAVTGSLNLEPSLLKIAYDQFFGAPPKQLAKNQAKKLNATQQPFDPGNPEAGPTQNDQKPEDLLDSKDPGDSINPNGDDNSKEAADKESDKSGGEGDKKGGDKGNDKDGKQSDKGADSKDGQNKDGGDQDKQGNPSDSGVLNKLKDALANMLNKMKPNANDSPKQQNAKNNQNGEKSDKGEKGEKQGDQKDGAESKSDDNPSGDQNQSDDAKSKASDQPGKPSAQESASGAGSKDGDKAAKDAKALEAMGKISEVLGKRSATVTGEMMIEVGNTKQTLKTAFTQQQAKHSEAGGEIHRDEVPLIFQPFVERYFEEIRKTQSTQSKQ